MRWFAVFLLATALASAIHADVPTVISYQGKLMQPSGAPVPDGAYTMRFAIYDDPVLSVGHEKWSETNTSVQTRGGLYSVLLGSITPIPPDLFGEPDRWFAVKVGDDPEMLPRQQIASAPFAMRAAVAGTVDDASITADKLVGGIPLDKLEAPRIDSESIGNAAPNILVSREVPIPALSAVSLGVDDGERWAIDPTARDVGGRCTGSVFQDRRGVSISFAEYCAVRGVPVTYAVVTNGIGKYNVGNCVFTDGPTGTPLLTHSDLIRLGRYLGAEVCSHSMTHLDPETLHDTLSDLRGSKATIEALYGVPRVRSYVFPGRAGAMNTRALRDGAGGILLQQLYTASRAATTPWSDSRTRSRHFRGATSAAAWGADQDVVDYARAIASPGNISVIGFHNSNDISFARLKLLVDELVAQRNAGKVALVSLNTACNGILVGSGGFPGGVRNASFELDRIQSDAPSAKQYAFGWSASSGSGHGFTRLAGENMDSEEHPHCLEAYQQSYDVCDLSTEVTLVPGRCYTAQWMAKSLTHGSASFFCWMVAQQAADAGCEYQQTIHFAGTVSGGTFTLGLPGKDGIVHHTGPITYSASSASLRGAVKELLAACGYIGGDCRVSGGPLPGDVTIGWEGTAAYEDLPTLEAVSQLTGSDPWIEVTKVSPGGLPHVVTDGSGGDSWNTFKTVPIVGPAGEWGMCSFCFYVPENTGRVILRVRPVSDSTYPLSVRIDDFSVVPA